MRGARNLALDEDVDRPAFELQDRGPRRGMGGRAHAPYSHEDTSLVFDEEEDDDDAAAAAASFDHVGSYRIDSPTRTGVRNEDRRLSSSSVASFQLYTPDEEMAVVRKFDRRLAFFLSACYMLSFIDRSNIGNARIAGMEEDLQTVPPNDSWYDWSLSAFYIAYIAFEWMSLLWRLIPAHIYVTLVVLSWGIIASLQAVATSYPMLIFLRTLLGIGEAAFTGVPFYLSFFYKRHELAFRTAMFISAAPLATTFAASLAWVILKVGEFGPIASWRLLFLIEGFPSVVVATIAWNVIPDSPQTASYLSPREKRVAHLRMRSERPNRNRKGATPQPSTGLKLMELASVLIDFKAWLMAFIFFLTNMAYASLPVFLPTILKEMGHTSLESQALSAPPYLIAFVSVYVTAQLSDKMHSRAPFVIIHALASAAGYSVLALARPLAIGPTIRYLAVYPAAMGFFNVVVLTLAWSINNQPSESKQGGGFALLQVVGQCGPLVGTRLYPKGDGPYFEHGMWACACAMLGVAVLAFILRISLVFLNRRLDTQDLARRGESEEAQGLVESAESKHPLATGGNAFRYML